MSMTTPTAFLDSKKMKNNDLTIETKQTKKTFWYCHFVEPIERFYMQFLLITTLYVMEPWERFLMMSIFFLIISLFAYSACVYIPFHFNNIIQSTMPKLATILWINQ